MTLVKLGFGMIVAVFLASPGTGVGPQALASAGAEGESPSQSHGGKGQAVPTPEYENDAFKYEEARDVYICPYGHELARITRTPVTDKNGRATHRYRAGRLRPASPTKQEDRSVRGPSLA